MSMDNDTWGLGDLLRGVWDVIDTYVVRGDDHRIHHRKAIGLTLHYFIEYLALRSRSLVLSAQVLLDSIDLEQGAWSNEVGTTQEALMIEQKTVVNPLRSPLQVASLPPSLFDQNGQPYRFAFLILLAHDARLIVCHS